jgi:beta-lactamase class A
MRRQVSVSLILLFCLTSAIHAADIATLRAHIEKVIPHARGQVGIAIKHVESRTELMVNADQTYPMASTYKVPILVELFYQQAAGKISLDDRIEFGPTDIHGGGPVAQLLDTPGIQLSVQNLINLMMRISDNSAADLILTKVGPSNVTARMQSLGLDKIRVDRTTLEMILDQSGVDYKKYGSRPLAEVREALAAVDAASAARANDEFNRTEKDVATPRQMNALIEKIYRGEIVDRAISDEIIEIMKRAEVGIARIRGLLPEDTVVAHKTGTISGSTNDTGIVFLPGSAGHLVITVLMKDAKAPAAERERVIAEISRYAYDYFVFNPSGH